MLTGTLMRFDPEKGYGFIKPDDGDKDLFMHVSALLHHGDVHQLAPGVTRVSYAVGDGGKGPKAVDVALTGEQAEEYQPEADVFLSEPAPATVASWRALWRQVSDAAFSELMVAARANGWVQD